MLTYKGFLKFYLAGWLGVSPTRLLILKTPNILIIISFSHLIYIL